MNFKETLKRFFTYEEKNKYQFYLSETHDETRDYNNYSKELIPELPNNQKIYPNIHVNEEFLRVKYNALLSKDIIIREFNLLAQGNTYSAFLLYIDGMVKTSSIDDFVLKPLMLRNRSNAYQDTETIKVNNNVKIKKKKSFDLENYIFYNLMPQNQVKKVDIFADIIGSVNMGNTALFVDTLPIAFDIDLKGFEHRTVSEPTNEIVIRGSQEAFVEAIRTNTSLIRRIINNEDLVIEESTVGDITKTRVAICYMKNITNDDLVAEVKFRLNNVKIDSITSSGQLEQLIQDKPNSMFPQILSTERADKASNHILEGRVVVLVNGNPYALIMPCILIDFLSSPEDINIKYQYANLLRLVRLFAFFITLLLPGIYVAITTFHHELMPTELLFAIASSREKVPFHVLFEIIIMEFSFELIREAGLRVPTPLGPTIGIVGALILGEAAVSANIVSPILIILVAITAICSFAISDYSLGFALRIYRFVYILLGYMAGFLGIATGLFIQFVLLANLSSFGVAYLSPYLPVTNISKSNRYFVLPIWKREKRSDFLNTKRKYRENKTSRSWDKN